MDATTSTKRRNGRRPAGDTLPHDELAETWLLGSYYRDPRLLDDPACAVEMSDLYLERNQAALGVLRILCDHGTPIDKTTFAAGMESVGRSREDALQILLPIAEIPHAAHAPHYAAIVRKKALRRHAEATAEEMRRLARNPTADDLTADFTALAQSFIDRAEQHDAGRKRLVVQSVREFASVLEDGAEPILGADDDCLIPSGGDVMVYGDGGAGKTTLCIDMGFFLAAGVPWLGIPVPRPMNVIYIENEGPRALFRRKIGAKLDGWEGPDVDEHLHCLAGPWHDFTFANSHHRRELASLILDLSIDVVFVGPLTAIGFDEAGTIAETRAFARLLDDVRQKSGRPVVFVLLHHENKGGKVSGAWEGTGDTLLHVAGRGNGRTAVRVQKARWAPGHHGKTLDLMWADNAGFVLDAKPEYEDDELCERIVQAIDDNPGTSWTGVLAMIKGVSKDRLAGLRDDLLADGRIVNVVKIDGRRETIDRIENGKPSKLYTYGDDAVSELFPVPGKVRER